MANSDADQLHRETSLSKMGILNFDSNQLYMFSRAPDMLHRMTILVAKMMHDGCFDAHSVVNEELVYDFKKDKRFSLLHSANPNVNSEEYRKQHALYITMLEQFNREGYNLKDGDALPKAYTARESASIKSFADMCFGHYDKNTQIYNPRGHLLLQKPQKPLCHSLSHPLLYHVFRTAQAHIRLFLQVHT